MGTRRRFLASTAAVGLPSMAGSASGAPSRVSGPWKLGCYTRPWDRYDYRVALDGIAEAGFPHVGIMTHKGKSWVIITPETTSSEAEQVGEEVRSRGLKTLSIYAEFKPGDSVEQGIRQLRRLIEHCGSCGSPSLLLGGTSDEKQFAPYYRAIAGCCDFAASRGIGLSIKPHGGLNATGPQCRKAIELVKHPSFGLWYDPGNIFYYSHGRLDPVADAATVDGLVVGMSVKDFRDPDEVMLTPGTGRVDFARVLRRLARGGFTSGPLIVECLDRGDARHVTAEASKALRFLKGLLV
jgi:sugar phosphate isomerase/epimerase